MEKRVLRIATRKSPLALWQARYVRDQLLQQHKSLDIELVKIVTRGDKVLDMPLAGIGGKGLFIKELEQGILAGKADIAVHSMKDVPVELPEGFELPVVCKREVPFDAFISSQYENIDQLPEGACVGTSSLRRSSQLLARRPDLKILGLRGNIQTRLAKLDNGDFDAIILAAAGLTRLDLAERIRSRILPDALLPAVGQGAIGVECRKGDAATKTLLGCLNDADTFTHVAAERAFSRRLEGGCQVPIAGYAERDGGNIRLRGLVASPDGEHVVTGEIRGVANDAEVLGISLAEDLLTRGADRILARLRASK